MDRLQKPASQYVGDSGIPWSSFQRSSVANRVRSSPRRMSPLGHPVRYHLHPQGSAYGSTAECFPLPAMDAGLAHPRSVCGSLNADWKVNLMIDVVVCNPTFIFPCFWILIPTCNDIYYRLKEPLFLMQCSGFMKILNRSIEGMNRDPNGSYPWRLQSWQNSKLKRWAVQRRSLYIWSEETDLIVIFLPDLWKV